MGLRTEPVLAAIIIFLVVVTIQYIIKPKLKPYHSKGWYGLSINIIAILLVFLYAVVIYILDAITEVPIIEEGLDFVVQTMLQIFGVIFMYEILKNIKVFVSTNGGDIEETEQ